MCEQRGRKKGRKEGREIQPVESGLTCYLGSAAVIANIAY
jgi:hypothetical protein